MKKTIKKTTQFFIVIFLALITVFSGVYSPINTHADETAIPKNTLDSTDPLADLSGDESFDITKYPYDRNGQLRLVSFNEYCYSFYEELRANFAIYLYIYNPAALELADSLFNRIQMAVGYDENGRPNDYEKFELELCSVSSGDYARLFYKFKIIDHLSNDGLTIYDRLNSNRRRYDVSGIELISSDAVNAAESNVSKTFYFSGYAKGYGPDYAATDSTLKCEYEDLETVTLDVDHTYWRSQTSDKGAGYQNQVDSVYFSIPNRFLRDYGRLQRIKAEWYEYLTKDIVVTSNQEFYNAAREYIGQAVNDDTFSWHLYQNLNLGVMGTSLNVVDWAYNDVFNAYGRKIDTLYYLFATSNWTSIENYDPYASVETSGGVLTNDLYEYLYSYNKTYENGTVKDGRISADLFEQDIENYRKIDNEFGKIQYGYSYYDFDADVDLFNLIAYNPSEHSFADNVGIYGFWITLFGTYETEQSFTDISPILLLNKNEYFSGSNQDISDRLFVNCDDVERIRSSVNTAKDNDETVVLFRFAVTDYYASNIDIVQGSYVGPFDSTISDQAYRAKESVFLDFDIIQLTFNNEGVYTVIPVVSNPIDIVDDITVPYDAKNDPDNSLWKGIKDVFNSIKAWLVFILSVIIGALLLIFSVMFIVKIAKSDKNKILKVAAILFTVSALIVIGYFAVPFLITLINNLGGL